MSWTRASFISISGALAAGGAAAPAAEASDGVLDTPGSALGPERSAAP